MGGNNHPLNGEDILVRVRVTGNGFSGFQGTLKLNLSSSGCQVCVVVSCFCGPQIHPQISAPNIRQSSVVITSCPTPPHPW